jgi:ribonuclease-3
LKKLSGDVLGDTEQLQYSLGATAGSDIAKAARQLHDAITQSAISRVSDCSIVCPKTCDEASRTTETSDLPRLPPVLDTSLLQAVFTHPGMVNTSGSGSSSEVSYDRLEILGDAYLETIATRLIWDSFPNLPSGRMSQVREDLVKNETLAHYATLYGFDRKVQAPQDHRNQPKRWTKTKADVFEAYIAAVILSDPSTGYQTAESWLVQLWMPRLAKVKQTKQMLNAKELLAKKIMSKGNNIRYIDEQPPKKMKGGMETFFIGVYFTGWGWNNQHLGSGYGPNKAIAGDEAAQQALLNRPLIDEIAAAKHEHDSRTEQDDIQLSEG